MKTEKRKITISINDVNDYEATYRAIGNLLKTVLFYYLEKKDMKVFEDFVVGLATYFGAILKGLGYEEDNFPYDKD